MSNEDDYIEIEGLKFVDATGQDLPREFIEIFVKAMVEAGALKYDEELGKYVPQLEEGKIVGLQFTTDEAGEIESTEFIDDEEIPAHLRPQ